MFRRFAISSVALIALAGCGSSDSDDAADATAAEAEPAAEGETEVVADDPNDGVVSEAEWAAVEPNLIDGGVTRPTHEITIEATDFVCADVETTSVTTTSEFIAEQFEFVVALAPDAGLDSTDVGAIIGTIATYACADAFSVLTVG